MPRLRQMRRWLACCSGCLLLPLAGDAALPPADTGSTCTGDARLEGRVYGAIEATLAWQPPGLKCEGMPRPHSAGARLRFAGPVSVGGSQRQLAIIVALPELEPGRTPAELRATVTLIEESAGRFFSTRDAEICWSDVDYQRPVGDDTLQYMIAGIVYCVAPLAELSGDGSVTLGDLRYAGRIDWRPPE